MLLHRNGGRAGDARALLFLDFTNVRVSILSGRTA